MQRRTFITDMQHIQKRLFIITIYAILETPCRLFSKVELIGSKKPCIIASAYCEKGIEC